MDDPRAPRACFVGTTGGEAASFIGSGAVLWTVERGCRVAGCEPPMICNRDSGFCERPSCEEGIACPNNTKCNLRSKRCEP